MNDQLEYDDAARERRRRRIEDMKRLKRRQILIRRLVIRLAPLALGVVIIGLLISIGGNVLQKPSGDGTTGNGKGGSATIQNDNKGNAQAAGGDEAGANGGSGLNGGTGGIGAAGGSEPEGAGAAGGNEAGGAGGSETGGAGAAGGSEAGGAGGNGAGESGSGPAEGNGPGTQAGSTSLGGNSQGKKVYGAQATSATKQLGADIVSSHAIIIDLASGDILAQKDAMSRISPASMTKVLTILVAAEHIEEKQLEDTFTITLDITDYSYVNDCSNVGFAENETVTVRDLFYGTILPSGADAAAGLAMYVAGSLDAFVELMNEKLEQLGLSDTAHFTNCVGLYDENHYCTVYDMAVILEAAIDNEFCREVMSAHTYTTSATEQHPEGILISNWFLRRIEDKDTGGEVVCGKTGYVVQSGNCAASYGVDNNGKGFICVTADATSGWKCIYDHVALYKQFSTSTA